MTPLFYTGGHSLDEILQARLQHFRSLPRVQDELANQLVSGEVVLTEPLRPGWWLELMKAGSHIMRDHCQWIEFVWPDGERHKAAEYRCHFPQQEPRLPDPEAPAPVPASKIQGKHKSPDTARAEAADLVAMIDAYQQEHACSQKGALDALYQTLGHNSPDALKVALSRAHKRLKAR